MYCLSEFCKSKGILKLDINYNKTPKNILIYDYLSKFDKKNNKNQENQKDKIIFNFDANNKIFVKPEYIKLEFKYNGY